MRLGPRRLTFSLAATLLFIALLCAGPAYATRASIVAGTLRIEMLSQELNDIQVQRNSTGTYSLFETGLGYCCVAVTWELTMRGAVGCSGTGQVTCPGESITGIRSVLLDSEDQIVLNNVTVPASIEGGNGPDYIDSGDGNDSLDGGLNADIIRAGGGNDDIDGGFGPDIIKAHDGADTISGGPDDDDISSAELVAPAFIDQVDCGLGDDEVEADLRDSVARNCENVTRAAVDQYPAVAIARRASRVDRRGVVRLLVVCPPDQPNGCRGRLTLKPRGRGSTARSARYALAAGRRTRVRIRLARRDRARLGRTGRLAARATAAEQDPLGRPKTTTVRLILRRR